MATPAAAAGSWPGVVRTPELRQKIKEANVLCVGAGGIGCELLKTLVCTGFEKIEVIDLDTIETSNLNRQFLFNKHHVGSSKAATAAEVVKGIRPSATITPHHANVKEPRFDVDFFKRFDLVLNGLDNMEARRHVNRLCLAAGVPLVESGSAGYIGQVTVHVKGVSECYECLPKAAPKSYPICTLRNTPDKPIHCIVWAKEMLFNRLFGKTEGATDLDEAANPDPDLSDARAHTSEPAANGASASSSASADLAAAAPGASDTDAASGEKPAEDPSFFLRREGEEALQYAARMFERLYTTDIQRVVSMTDLWKARTPPTPLQLTELVPDLQSLTQDAEATGPTTSASKALGLRNPNQKWTPEQNAAVFLKSILLFLKHRTGDLGSAVFDKDDDLAVDFVTSASNLRCHAYSIPTQSLFDAKGMAGNIIHAIATTNAIISGLIVVEAIKLLAGLHSALRNTYLYNGGRTPLVANHLQGPRSDCMVCSKAQLTLRVNTQTMTLGTLLSAVIKKQLAVATPNLLSGDFLYEEGEGLEEDEVAAYAALLAVPLASLPAGGLTHGSQLTVQDQVQHFSVELLIVHQDSFDEEQVSEGFILEGALSAAQTAEGQAAAAAAAEAATATVTGAGSSAGPSGPPTSDKPNVTVDHGDYIAVDLELDDSNGLVTADTAGPSGSGGVGVTSMDGAGGPKPSGSTAANGDAGTGEPSGSGTTTAGEGSGKSDERRGKRKVVGGAEEGRDSSGENAQDAQGTAKRLKVVAPSGDADDAVELD